MKKILCLLLIISISMGFTVSFAENQVFKQIEWKNKVDPFGASLDLSDIGLSEFDLLGFDIQRNGQREGITYNVIDSKVSIISELKLNTNYLLRVFTKKDDYEIKFVTDDLSQVYETGDRIIVKIPAMPEKGFKWPYYLAIPSNQYKNENKNHKRYLLVDTINTGVSADYNYADKWVKDTLSYMNQYSVAVGERLWAPMLIPVFPQPNVFYNYNGEQNMTYEHAFDRDMATLHNKVKIPDLRQKIALEYANKGLNVDDFLKLDEQLLAMFNHAVEYLNKYNHNVDKEKMFLCGYSASGTFTDRFTALHPENVKAVASGGTLDDMILPLSKYKNENLIFPIGTYDYKEITGKDFDLTLHNNVARMIYMGKDDDNNTVPYTDCYGDTERNIIKGLWGVDVLPRAQALIKLYGESGGKGIFILDKGIGHSSSGEMMDHVLQFFKDNRDNNTPVYSIPNNTNQLEYTLYK